ncbi:MAG: GNAT family N-acetyltransferase [Erythrobacter sp.]|uniref:GNAT family N-acetyltransferase n=1 Tax=Erythrobacter sp. TaxID=1042 RepID=UPI003C7595F1
MFHRSERLLLRPIWPEDWEAIFSGIADEGVVRNLARAPWPYEESDAREFAALPADPLLPRFLVTRAVDARVVGCIGLAAEDCDIPQDDEGAVELGYWIARPYWGQGYATEAGRAVIALARMLGHRRVVGSHFLDNPASGRVLEKLGFRPTGRRIARHSCGRGAPAMTAQYALSLADSRRVDAARAA